MHELRTEIEIAATPGQIWEVLMDFEHYPDWNPFIRRIEGEARPGARLRVVLQPVGREPSTIHPRIVQLDPPYVFKWLGHLGVSGLFDGEHLFEVECLPERHCRFVQQEVFRGVMIPFSGRLLEDVRRSFEAMNRALAARVETRTGHPRELEELEAPVP